MMAARTLDGLTAGLLCFSRSLTGFLFPFHKLVPSQVVGSVSLAVLAVAILARFAGHLTGAWRGIYAVLLTLGVNVQGHE